MFLPARRVPIGPLVLALVLGTGAFPSSLESQPPKPTVFFQGVPSDVLIGETFHFKVFFRADPAFTGFGPFLELYLAYQGADCTKQPPVQGGPCDGLRFVQAEALFANGNVPLPSVPAGCPFVFPSSPPCMPACQGTCLPSPGDFFGVPPPPLPGFQKVVLTLPFGSFVTGQPDVEIDVAVQVHAFADANFPLQILARGGFRFGDGNPPTLPSVGPFVNASVTSHVFTLHKSYLGPEDETATGPNFPRQYRIEVDVADGQAVSSLEIKDCLPGNLTFLGLASASPPPLGPPIPMPNNCFLVQFPNLTGGPGGPEVVETLDFFVPELDDLGNPVLDSSCRATSDDQATVSAVWTQQDPRDVPPSIDSVTDGHTLTDKCLAVQKSVAVAVDTGAPGPTPGDILKYTLDFQLSDFRTIRNLVLNDYLSDGQTLLLTPPPPLHPPRLTIGDKFGGPVTGTFGPPTLSQVVVPAAPCQTADPTIRPRRIRFRVSQLFASLDAVPRHSLGILTGGHASQPAGGAATGQIVFFARIDDQYQRQPLALEPFVDKGDPLLNCTIANAQVMGNVNAPTLPSQVLGLTNDSSATEVEIVIGRLDKSVYAINGNTTFPLPPKVSPGDRVTFRIQYPIPSSDAEKLKVVDYSPIPALPISGFALDAGACSNFAPPPVKVARTVGPLCTAFPAKPIFTFSGPTAPNSLTFDYGNIQAANNLPRSVDLLYTVEVSPAPFVDGLLLTNEAFEQESNTFGRTSAQAAIAPITLCEPKLRVRKGVVSTSKASAAFNPAPPALAGVTFAPPNAPGPAFTGTITSAKVESALHSELHSDLSGVDGCDVVKYAIVIENLGCSAKGAFDVRLRDLLPNCMGLRSNLQVRNGQGTPLTCNGGCTLSSLFSTGIILDDPSGVGALGPYSPGGGKNLAVITFDARVPCGGAAPGCCANKAQLVGYAGVEGGPNHVPSNLSTPFPFATSAFLDSADVCIRPALTKSIVTTSEPHTGQVGGVEQLAIGEIVTYKLQVVVPEGISPAMKITDTLPAALAWLPGSCSVTKSPPINATNPLTVLLSGANLSLLSLDLGNVTNTANNPAAEILTVVCKALVLNLPANATPAPKPNSFSVQIKPTGQPVLTFTSNSVPAAIVEPVGSVTKVELPSVVPGHIVYILTFTNSGTATAFDATLLDNLPAPLTTFGPILVSPPQCLVAPTALNQVKVTCPTVPVGAMVKVQFEVTGVPLCQTLQNLAQLTYTSLPGPKGTGGATPGASGATNGERVYLSSSGVGTNLCPDLVITKTHSGDFPAGQTGTYTITVKNTGTAASVPLDTVQDMLPAGFGFLSGGGNGWTCTSSNGQDVTCVSGTSILPGATSTFTITVSVPCGSSPVNNCAQVTTTSEFDLSDNRACDPTIVVVGTPPGGCIIAVATGFAHSLVVRSDHTGFAWGSNGSGELGDGTTTTRTAPVAIQGLTGIAALTGGQGHSLGLRQDGTVWAWGRNDFGALGNGTFASSALPVQVKAPGGTGFLTGVVAVSAGGLHSLALLGNGQVLAWGYNQSGQLGNGTTAISNVPIQVPGLVGVVAIAAGYEYSLALLSDGSVRAWGANLVGQLGNGTSVASNVPIAVLAPGGTGPLFGVKAIAAGAQHGLALLTNSTVLAWGIGQSGQLGNGGIALSKLPVQVLGVGGAGNLSGVTALAGGGEHSLAVLGNGTAIAWGLGRTLGNGGSINSSVPVAVSGLTGITALAAGSGTHSMALVADGSIRVWGDNHAGQLGDGTTVDRLSPVPVAIPCPACVPPPPTMTAWWPFDETAGTTSADIAGATHNDGTRQPALGPTSAPGRVAGALCFDGIDDRVEVPDDPELDVDAGDFTIDAWVRATTSFLQTIVDKRDESPSPRGYAFFLLNGRLFLQMAIGVGGVNCSTSPSDACTNFGTSGPNVGDGQWHHVAVTVDRDNAQGGVFYVDGDPIATTFNPTLRSQSLATAAGALIGARPADLDGDGRLNGCLDELEIFKRALTPAEIKAIYNAASSGKCKCLPPLCTYYSAPAAFHADHPGLVFEDFESGNVAPGTFKACDSPLDATSGDATGCFSPGALPPGVRFQNSGSQTLGLALFGAGFSGSTSKSLRARISNESFRASFTPAAGAVGWKRSPSAPQLITVTTAAGPSLQSIAGGNFVGVCCRFPISSIDVFATDPANQFEGMDDLEFGAGGICR